MLAPIARIGSFLLTLWAFSPFAWAQDAVAERLEDLKQKYTTAAQSARDELVNAMTAAIKQQAADGNLTAVAQLARENESLLQSGEIPQSPIVAAAVAEYRNKMARYNSTMLSCYEQALKDYTKQLNIEAATDVERQMKAFQQSQSLGKPESTGDPILDSLAAAKQRHQSDFDEAKTDLVAYVDAALKKAASEGDLAKVKELHAAKEALEKDPQQKLAAPALAVKAQERFRSDVRKSASLLETAYKKAITDLRKSNRTGEAGSLQRELMLGVGLERPKWVVLFHSDDPKHWGQAVSQGDDFAATLDQAPGDIRYLRLKHAGSGAYVIIPIRNEELKQNLVQQNIGWSGNNVRHEQAQRFGIYRTDFKNEQRGLVVVGSQGFSPYTGWGFGSRHNVDDRQAYVWGGREIAPTAFEIAVTSQDLDATEARSLLVKGTP